MAKCMYCGAPLEILDEWGLSCDEDDFSARECGGACTKCGKRYRWSEKYKLVTIEGMEEIKEEE